MFYIKKIVVVLFLLIPIYSASQGISNLWMSGYLSGSIYLEFGGTNIDFFNGFPDTSHVNRSMNIGECNANISDSAGNLLFYTNGVFIANVNNDTMMDGDSLNLYAYSGSYGLRIRQGNLIIPYPDHPNIYYLFHETYYILPTGVGTVLNIYYSIIDMTLDGGLGAVTQKNQLLLADTLTVGGITACKHANGRDWWVIFHKKSGRTYYEYLFSPAGLQGPFIQNIGCAFPYTNDFIWQCCFSPDGKKFSAVTYRDTLDIMDFDRCTGILSNSISISINDSGVGRGVAFSPNSRYLYLSSMNYLYQYDTDSSNIPASQIIIDKYDGFVDQGLPFTAQFYLLHLAHNKKIYMITHNGSQWMHVINHPDQSGLACDFLQHGLMIPTYNAGTIPNFPNFFLGSENNTICDSLINNKTEQMAQKGIKIFPNPARNKLFITGSPSSEIKYIKIENTIGEIVLEKSINAVEEIIQMDITNLITGVYFINIIQENGITTNKFIKIN